MKRPNQEFWQVEYLARLLTFCSVNSGESVYYDAWVESARIYYALDRPVTSDHPAIQILQFIPWTQAVLANARLTDDGKIVKNPYYGYEGRVIGLE